MIYSHTEIFLHVNNLRWYMHYAAYQNGYFEDSYGGSAED